MILRNKLSAGIILVIVLISTALIPFSFDMFFVGQLDIVRYFNLQHAAPVLYLWSWGMCLGQIVLAPLLDSIGRKYILITGIALNIVLSFIAISTGDINVIYFVRFLQGFAAAVQIIGSRAIIWDLFKTHECNMARAYNATIIFTLVFALIALNLSSWLVVEFGWQMLFMFLIGYSTILVFLLFLIPETLTTRTRFCPWQVLKNYQKLLIQPGFMTYTLVGGLIYAFLFATFTGLPVIFTQVYDLNPYQISQLFSLNLLCGIAGGLLNNWLLKRNISCIFLLHASYRVIAIFTVMILGLTSFVPELSLWIFVPLFLCIHISISFITANSMTAAVNEITESTGGALAVYGIIQFGMGALASAMVPVMFNWFGISLFSMFIICMASILLILIIDLWYKADLNNRKNNTNLSIQENKLT